MSPARTRRATAPVELWRGSHEARTVWFSEPGEPAARRILGLWRTGASVHELREGWLLRLPEPVRLDEASAPGMLLIEVGGTFWGAVPRPDDRAEVAAGHVVLPIAGALNTTPLAMLAPVQPHLWFDIGEFALREVSPLGLPPAPTPAPRGFDVRAALRRPPVPAETTALMGALSGGGQGGGLPDWLAGPLRALASWAAGVAPAKVTAGGGETPAGGGQTPAAAAARAPLPPRPPSAFTVWLRRLAAPLWGPLLGGAHGRHLNHLLELFSSEKLDEALRWAIPLGGEGPDFGAAWTRPGPRASLQLQSWGAAGGGTIGLEQDLLSHLRRLYEAALEKLLLERRIDDAVFVLVELLKAHSRAVDLLEREERFAFAAEIAEAAQLPPERTVRLWVRAGELGRAVELARRTGAFAAAVAALTPTDAPAAEGLRWAWSTHLADRGDFAGAVTVAWAVPALRPRAVPWLVTALAAGTPAAAGLVALLLHQTPATFNLARLRVEALLTGSGLEHIRLRQALASGLARQGGAHGRRLLRPVLRALVTDQREAPEVVEAAWLQKVAQNVDDPALAADLPALTTALAPLRTRATPLHLDVAVGDTGTTPIYDAAWFPDGGLLVALGELGARSYGADGRVRARFDVPTTDLVVDTTAGRALAVARRALTVRVSRLDLRARTATAWHDGRYTAWAESYDGNLWFVAENEAAMALDAVAAEPRALWRVNQVGGTIHSFEVTPEALAFAVGFAPSRELWFHRLPDLRLLSRPPMPAPAAGSMECFARAGHLHSVTVASDGAAVALTTLSSTPGPQAVRRVSLGELTTPGWRAGGLRVHGEWTAILLKRPAEGAHPGEAGVLLASADRPVLTLRLRGATTASMRLDAESFTLADDRGRAFVFDLWRGGCLRDVRVG